MKYENKSLCAACGGKCCKSGPCFFMPEDFKDLSVEGLLKEFKEKDYLCICLEDVPFISIRLEQWKKVIDPLTYYRGGTCPLLTPSGCPFSYEERPTSAKLLVPSPNNDCESILPDYKVDLEWLPYRPVLLYIATTLC